MLGSRVHSIGDNMCRLLFAVLVSLGLNLQPASAQIELQLTGFAHGLGQGSDVERSIAVVFNHQIRDWTRIFPKGSTVTIDNCTLRIAGRHGGIPFEGAVNFSMIDWEALRIESCESTGPLLVIEPNQPSGYFGKLMFIRMQMSDQSAW